MPKARRVVIGTNVLISAALIGDSAPAQLVQMVLQRARVVFSEATFAELETRLWRAKFDRYLSLEARKALLHDWRAVADWANPTSSTSTSSPRYSRDPSDDLFIHAALAGGAALLVSGDRDLLDLGAVDGVAILAPAPALVQIQGWPAD